MWKKVFLILFSLLGLLALFNWQLVKYGYSQAKGQLSIIQKSRPIEEVLGDPVIADSIKLKIQLIQKVKLFATNELGLAKTENYTSYYDQHGKVSLWNLSACEPFSFSPKEWKFPLLGSFPYKGFFDLDEAKKEYRELVSEGYDARIRSVGGWSTLGWTNDPILSNMLGRSTGSLTELIIHELTHTTLFVKDDIIFNENLASFIGVVGAQQFLSKEYGRNSNEMIEYLDSEEDAKTFRNHMLSSSQALKALYEGFAENLSDSIKEKQKHGLINQIISSLDTMRFNNSRYHQIFSTNRPNNAYFMSYTRYYSSEDSLKNILQETYSGDLRNFVEGMVEYHK